MKPPAAQTETAGYQPQAVGTAQRGYGDLNTNAMNLPAAETAGTVQRGYGDLNTNASKIRAKGKAKALPIVAAVVVIAVLAIVVTTMFPSDGNSSHGRDNSRLPGESTADGGVRRANISMSNTELLEFVNNDLHAIRGLFNNISIGMFYKTQNISNEFPYLFYVSPSRRHDFIEGLGGATLGAITGKIPLDLIQSINEIKDVYDNVQTGLAVLDSASSIISGAMLDIDTRESTAQAVIFPYGRIRPQLDYIGEDFTAWDIYSFIEYFDILLMYYMTLLQIDIAELGRDWEDKVLYFDGVEIIRTPNGASDMSVANYERFLGDRDELLEMLRIYEYSAFLIEFYEQILSGGFLEQPGSFTAAGSLDIPRAYRDLGDAWFSPISNFIPGSRHMSGLASEFWRIDMERKAIGLGRDISGFAPSFAYSVAGLVLSEIAYMKTDRDIMSIYQFSGIAEPNSYAGNQLIPGINRTNQSIWDVYAFINFADILDETGNEEEWVARRILAANVPWFREQLDAAVRYAALDLKFLQMEYENAIRIYNLWTVRLDKYYGFRYYVENRYTDSWYRMNVTFFDEFMLASELLNSLGLDLDNLSASELSRVEEFLAKMDYADNLYIHGPLREAAERGFLPGKSNVWMPPIFPSDFEMIEDGFRWPDQNEDYVNARYPLGTAEELERFRQRFG